MHFFCRFAFATLVLLGSSIYGSNVLRAQRLTSHNPALSAFAQDFSATYQYAAQGSSELNASLQYFDDFASTSFLSLFMNNTRRASQGTIGEYMRAQSTRNSRDGAVQYELTFKQIILAQVSGNMGMAIFTLDYVQTEHDRLISKGTENITLVCRTHQDGWKIIDFRSVMLETERYRGACLCEVQDGLNKNELQVKVTMPAGKNYETLSANATITDCDKRTQVKLIQYENKSFKWLISGELYRTYTDSACAEKPVQEAFIGLAPNKYEAIAIIVSKDLFSNYCSVATVKR